LARECTAVHVIPIADIAKGDATSAKIAVKEASADRSAI
jgi:hypothetical protein